MPTRSFAGGCFQALAVIALFPTLGLAARAALEAGSAPPLYSPAWMDEIRAEDAAAPEEPEIWLVDGFNVVQVALIAGRDRSGWWSAERRQELLSRAARLTDAGVPVEVVFDGWRPAPDSEAPGPRQIFAESADEWLLERVRHAADPARVAVVTADRRLAERLRRRGARVVSPVEFLRRCTI